MEQYGQTTLDERACGILLPVFSLSSPYGIGTLGAAAYDLIDWLVAAGQKYWQVLPVHSTTPENSPYTAFSAMAGNELLIDLDLLKKWGFLRKADLDNLDEDACGKNPSRIAYAKVRATREKIFDAAFECFRVNTPTDFQQFCDENQFWLDDFALFMAIKRSLKMAKLKDWPWELKFREEEAILNFRHENTDEINRQKMMQYLFFKQWSELREYANYKGISIIGDIPFYVGEDSADVWAHPEVFELDEELQPTQVAGCPPDIFCEDGQLWGNPVYDWAYLKRSKYEWWMRRLKMSFYLYDVLRIDHFRGFESFYSIDAQAETAKNGLWVKGPGYDFFKQVNNVLGEQAIIAEDLGYITDDVHALLDECGFPGMKVIQFAFDTPPDFEDYYPYKFPKNCVAYSGNHDNDTCVGWIKSANKKKVEFAMRFLNVRTPREVPHAMIYAVMSSVANTCILCAQDLLDLGSEARMNIPSTTTGNWAWRITNEQIAQLNPANLLEVTQMYGRAKVVKKA